MKTHGRYHHGWKSIEFCEPELFYNIQHNAWKVQDVV